MKKLIVNADDFGYAAGVNRGIIEAHRNGIVTSTTVMINYPHAAPGLEQALQDAPDLSIGLHVTLTSGTPVSAPDTVSSLLNADGRFHHINDWPQHFATFDPDHLRREIETQVARFITLTGQPPDHLDAHHHAAYLHPAALETLLDRAAAHHIPMRDGMINHPTDKVLRHLGGLLPALATDQGRAIIDDARAVLADRPAPFWPAHFEMGFYGPTATLGDLLLILTNLPADGITELMCHPGYLDDGLRHSGYTTQREDEIEHLTHPATRECIQYEFIDLINFGAVPRQDDAL
ncbi:MAG: ChbG/HpnK family deacetylase [Anaerolineae bacterium]|nr:ChbG/HpnK family deacetylase [Anaerolineae bacterium]